MIKILLNGCGGKMGRTISSNIANFKNLEIGLGVDAYSAPVNAFPVYKKLSSDMSADVLLDFSNPNSLQDILNLITEKKIPAVICTTGYNEEQIKKIEEASKIVPIFRSANMSIGINIVNSILKKISSALYQDFDIEIIEKHHKEKLDAPSGTALLLANTIKNSIDKDIKYSYGRGEIRKREKAEIGIHAVRGGSIVGEHDVIFAGQGEVIELKHEALSRDVFAVGALKACEFIANKAPGLYNMDNLIEEASK